MYRDKTKKQACVAAVADDEDINEIQMPAPNVPSTLWFPDETGKRPLWRSISLKPSARRAQQNEKKLNSVTITIWSRIKLKI